MESLKGMSHVQLEIAANLAFDSHPHHYQKENGHRQDKRRQR
jgi:hypothetical protein